MKYLQKLAGISVLIVLGIMVLALFRPKTGEMSVTPLDGIEYFFDEGWTVAVIEEAEILKAEQESGKRQELIEEALEKGNQEQVLPYLGKCNANDHVVFQNILPKDYGGMTLNISSAATVLRVTLDGELLYHDDGGVHDAADLQAHFEKSNSIHIPLRISEGKLWIECVSTSPDLATSLNQVSVAVHGVMLMGMSGSDIADIVCCLLILIMAVIMFVLALIRLYTRQPARGELFLGLAGLNAGLYYFIEVDILCIFYGVQTAGDILRDLRLLLPLVLTLYFGKNLKEMFPHRFSVLLWCINFHTLAQILLRVCNLQDLVESEYTSMAAMAAVCLIAVISMLQLDYRNRSRETVPTVLAVIVLLAGELADVVLTLFFQDSGISTIRQYCMVVFGTIMIVIHLLRLAKEYRANAEENARLLQEQVIAAQEQNLQLIQAKQDADSARQEAMAANEAKGKFLAHMSHEIRTPINAVLGMDEMILRESREPNVKEYAMDIYMAGQTLLSLINDILDFSKIESGKMEIVPVEYDVSSLIHDVANMAAQRAREKGLRFEIEADHAIPSLLYGDDVRIRQILTNLLSNAVKYTHEGTVWLRVSSRPEGERAVLRFEVEDTGIGIKEADLPKLSAEFERIEEERNRNIEGTGLGMSITIKLLALLDSKLQVESVYGKGSKFYFELEQKLLDAAPIGDFESRVRQISENYSYGTKFTAPDAQVLVVDDNAVNRKVFRNLLKETGIRITDASGGAECLELVQENHYDLIFLDHMMPEMDGVETLHHIREFSDFPCQGTPIVVLTANAVSGAKEKYLAEGFDNFLSKPIVPEKLEDMIKRMLPEEFIREGAMEGTPQQQEETGISGDVLENLPAVDGLDWQYAWLHLPDLELLEYTVKEFYAQLDSAGENLEETYRKIEDADQLERYRIQVHAMKSLAATVGILPLSGLAKVLEYAAKDGKIETIRSVTPTFLEEWSSYRQKLRGVFGIEAQEKKEVTDFAVIRALVEMIRMSMEEMDIDQADELIGQLRAYEFPQEIDQNIRKLAEAVTNLDPEETDRLAKLLIEQWK